MGDCANKDALPILPSVQKKERPKRPSIKRSFDVGLCEESKELKYIRVKGFCAPS